MNMTKLFVLLQDIFYYYTAVFNKLLEIIKENQGLQSLLEEIAAILGNPGSIVNRNLKVLAGISYMPNTVNEKFYSEFIKKIQTNGYSVGGSKMGIETYLSKNNHNTEKPVFFNVNDGAEFPCISYNIKLQNKTIGWFNVYEVEKPFTETTSDLMMFFSEILSIELSKNELISLNDETKYEYLCADLLDVKSLSNREIEQLFEYLNFPMCNDYLLIVITSPMISNEYSKFSYLKSMILSFVKCNLCILYKHRIVMIFESSSEHLFSQFRTFLADSNMFAGISKSFTNIKDIKKAYTEAVKAVELGIKLNEPGSIFRYKDLQLYHLIDLCAKQKDIKDFCVPTLFKLMEYDPELSMTLYLYLRNEKSQAKTARELHIQRSSLLYRLRKIEEILELKLDDYQSVLHLQLSYEILNYLDGINFIRSELIFG